MVSGALAGADGHHAAMRCRWSASCPADCPAFDVVGLPDAAVQGGPGAGPGGGQELRRPSSRSAASP